MTDRFADQMKREAGELGIALNGGQLEQFFRYYEFLVERNKVMNLTAITEEQDVVTKHFTDSLSLVKLMGAEAFAGKTLMDVGTGAGFPGIPLKIAFPELNVTLMDVCEELGLKDITAVHGRAEDLGRNLQYREQFDLCVSRAVANLASLSEYCMPFVKVGGDFVPYKSGEIEEELEAGKRAVKILGGEVERVEKFTLPGADESRSLIRIRKIKGISGKYPRKAGLPTKEPLY